MVEFRIKVNPIQRVAYMPRELYETLGSKLRAVANRKAVALYPEGASLEDVIVSLKLILQDLEHAIQLERRGSK